MLSLLVVAIILGGIIAGITGMSFLFWVVSIAIFVCGLPFALINGFIQDKIDYIQDREDYCQLMRDLREDAIREDELIERKLDRLNKRNNADIFIDNREVHFHNIKYDDVDKDEHIITNGNNKKY
jgi:flagellar motor component MotA